MRIIKSLFRNLSIFLLAGLFSLAILYFVKNPDFLQASVLNAGEVSLIQKNKRDIAYKQSEGLIDIFFGSSLKSKEVTIILAQDPAIIIDPSQLSGQCQSNITSKDQGTTTINIKCNDFSADQSILIIPFTGKSQDILIEEGYYFDNNSKNNLSIGNISINTEHSK